MCVCVCVCVCVAMGERRVRVDLAVGLFSITEPLFVVGVMLTAFDYTRRPI